MWICISETSWGSNDLVLICCCVPPAAFSISSENSQVVMIAISAAVAIILLTVVGYILIGRSVPSTSLPRIQRHCTLVALWTLES